MLSRIVIAGCLGISLAAVAAVWPEPTGEPVRVHSRAQHLAALEADGHIDLARALVQLASESCDPAPAPRATPSRVPAAQGRHDI